MIQKREIARSELTRLAWIGRIWALKVGDLTGLGPYIFHFTIAEILALLAGKEVPIALDAMNKDSGVDLTALKVDGGMVYNNTLMQFQADILGVPVIRPTVAETTALGAAHAAGLAVGFWAKVEDLRVNWGKDHEWDPKLAPETRQELHDVLAQGCDPHFRLG